MTKRVALVIGNAAYRNDEVRLRNPTKDATAVAAALKKVGFQVDCGLDLTIDETDAYLDQFRKNISRADAALFFFAGHGLQADGRNYLLPVDARISDRHHLERYALQLDGVLDDMTRSATVSLIFLDACRRDFASTSRAGRARSPGAPAGGLTKVAYDGKKLGGGKSIFVGFATAYGSDGFDGVGEHSPFTDAILRHIHTPDVSVKDMMSSVTRDVALATNQLQIPCDESSMPVPFCFLEKGTVSDRATSTDRYAALDALSPKTFDDHPSALHCVVVTAELPHPQSTAIDTYVRRAIEQHPKIAETAAGLSKRINSDRTPPEAAAGAERRRVVRSRLDTSRAFSTPDDLRAAVRALCRADIAVFDITDLQPGVMLLLGVRSVARRGVTICSHGKNYVHGQSLELPFNLQMLNVASHSEAQARSANSPSKLIGGKIVRGLEELATLPDYMDLPAYDPVRTLGPRIEHFTAIPVRDKILVLCPFSPGYEDQNWRTLKEEVLGKLAMRDVDRPRTEIAQASPGEDGGPVVVRLLDEESPRLVIQTLYELIRRVDMCIVDWTRLRPNVMFELGVRLAVNRLGAVHIADADEMASDEFTEVDSARAQLKHANQLKRLFHIIHYSSKTHEAEPFEQMVEWFYSGYSAIDQSSHRDRSMDFLIYEAIGENLSRDSDDLSLSIADELFDRANLLANPDEDSTGVSSILYRDANEAIWRQAQMSAVERRMAAWLYIDACYEDDEILKNDVLLQKFRGLGNEVRRWFNTQREISNRELSDADKKIEKRIRDRMRGLRATN